MDFVGALKGRDFINLEDFTKEQLESLLNLASSLKGEIKKGLKLNILSGKNLVMYFAKPSLRTRLSFEIGMQKLGGNAVVIKQDEIILGKRESIEDTARVISKYADAVMIRTFAHNDVTKFAEYASIPVINALTDLSHPCQIMADFLTIQEVFKSLDGVKIAYISDGNNMANTLLVGGALFGMNISVAAPQGYKPDVNEIEKAKKIAGKTHSYIEIVEDPFEAVKDADVVYGDTWTSMGQEKEHEIRKEVFKNYQINRELLQNAKKNVIVLHCLPAHKGEEISEDVFEAYSENIFNEAENRMYAQMAVMASIM